MNNKPQTNIPSTFLRLRSDASIEALPVDEQFWPRLMSGELGSWHNEFLVSCLDFNGDWGSWEVHPNGDEVVILLSGEVRFVFELDGGQQPETLLSKPGDFVFVPQGTWHTARMSTPSRLLFITAGEGTQGREA